MHIRLHLTLLMAAVLLPAVAHARVVRLVIEQKRVFADGTSFGEAGPYERLDGTAHMEVDPADPLNRLIVNLDKAPRTPGGMVEFSAPFVILKPVNMARSNRKIWCGINNRGNMLELQQRSFDPTPPYPFTNDPMSVADIGGSSCWSSATCSSMRAGRAMRAAPTTGGRPRCRCRVRPTAARSSARFASNTRAEDSPSR